MHSVPGTLEDIRGHVSIGEPSSGCRKASWPVEPGTEEAAPPSPAPGTSHGTETHCEVGKRLLSENSKAESPGR